MVRQLRLGLSCVVLTAVMACGGNKNSTPTTPSAPATPTVNSIAISGLDAVRTGFFTNYTTTASMSDGTTPTVTPSWTSSNPNIASVDATGRLDAYAHGSINLAASYQGRSASKNVSMVHNYGGNWTGTYAIQVCDQSGVFAQIRWCQGLGGIGAILPFSLALTQSGNGRDQISGTISLGSLSGNISGNVTGDARLVIGGSYNVTSSGVAFTIVIGGWDTRSAAGDSMSGGWAQNLSAIGVAGNAYQQNRIVTVNHISPQGTIAAVPDRYLLSLSDLFDIMKH